MLLFLTNADCLLMLPSPERQKAVWESNHLKSLYFNLTTTLFTNSNHGLGVRNQTSYMPIPIFHYFDNSRFFELAEQGVAFFMAESLQIISWMTGNDLGIVFYSLPIFFFLFTVLQKDAAYSKNQKVVHSCVCRSVCFADFRKASDSNHSL